MARLGFSDQLAIFGLILTLVLVVLDKAGKLKGPTLFVLLFIAAAMTLPLAWDNSWVNDVSSMVPLWFRRTVLIAVVAAIYVAIAIWISGGDSSDVAAKLPPSPRITCKVEAAQFEQFYRFFQDPPVYFQRLDSALRISLTNQVGKPLYIRRYSVAALVGVEWVQFKNADNAACEPYAFGLMGLGQDKAYLRRFDLSENGFDYVMQEKPLSPDENLELWMFFISGLLPKDKRSINQFKFSFYDSAGEEFPCTSDYSTKSDVGTVVGTQTGQLKVMPFEPIPPKLIEEPAH